MLTIYQSFHKDYPSPEGCPWIKPIAVGGYRSQGMLSDATGEHISHLNKYFCELTAQYWVWKNSEGAPDDVVGFYHYRRYLNFILDSTWTGDFAFEVPLDAGMLSYLSHPQQALCAQALMAVCDAVIPARYCTEESVEAHFLKFHIKEQWHYFLQVIEHFFPQDAAAMRLYQLSNRTTVYNMFLMRRKLFEAYCSDLFKVLSAVFTHFGAGYGPWNDRYPGFLAERFLGFWLHVRGARIVEVPTLLLKPPA